MGSGLGDAIRLQIPKGRYVALVKRMKVSSPPDFMTANLSPPLEIPVRALNGLRGMSVFPAFSPDFARW